jgi:hypothetical protein
VSLIGLVISGHSGRVTGKPEVSRVDGPGLKAHFF